MIFGANSMIKTEPTVLTSLILSGLALLFGIPSGYLVRIIQKREEKKDEINLKFLPSLNYGVSSFIEATYYFRLHRQLTMYIQKINDINIKIDERLFTGEILFFKEDFQKKLRDFSRDLREFQYKLELAGDDVNTTDLLIDAFDSKGKFLDEDTDPNMLIIKAKEIQADIIFKIRKYRSPLSLLVSLLVAFLLCIFATVFKFLVPVIGQK